MVFPPKINVSATQSKAIGFTIFRTLGNFYLKKKQVKAK
jgi:hypothetical protein